MIDCTEGHTTHDTVTVHVCLKGQPKVWEYPAIPDRLGMEFDFRVFDYYKYRDPNRRIVYCPGVDDLSVSLIENGIWEGFETVLMLAALKEQAGKGIVMDFGSHVGWFSVLAGRMGYAVEAWDCVGEMCRVLQENAELNGLSHLTVHHEFVDENTVVPSTDVAFFKADLEGGEPDLLQAAWGLFRDRHVAYALLEMSPCFNDQYARVAQAIMDCGYSAFDIPSKSSINREAFTVDPRIAIQLYQVSNPVESLRNVYQTNYLFIKQD